jgi:hypothetical protein
MIMFVLDDPDCLDAILDAWAGLGVSGATIMESTGFFRHHIQHIPMRYAYGETSSNESGNLTLFVIVENESIAQVCLKAVEKIVGNLDDPDTGVFAAWPLALTKGIPSRVSG